LNVFKTRTLKGHETQQRIFATALALFRKQGFEATTMRDVAAAADLSLGAAYHYFPSKEAIVLAYYDQVQDDHARRVEDALQRGLPLRDVLGAVFHAKLDILSDDRPLMGALLRYTGDPSHPLSFLGPATRDLQLRSMALFSAALTRERLPDDLRTLLPTLLWAMHMGLLLYFLYDDSPRHRRTRALTDGAIDVFLRTLSMAKLPLLRPIRRQVIQLLDDAGLLASEQAIARATALRSREVYEAGS
jgi:AcrR family transcriptional regulator